MGDNKKKDEGSEGNTRDGRDANGGLFLGACW